MCGFAHAVKKNAEVFMEIKESTIFFAHKSQNFPLTIISSPINISGKHLHKTMTLFNVEYLFSHSGEYYAVTFVDIKESVENSSISLKTNLKDTEQSTEDESFF